MVKTSFQIKVSVATRTRAMRASQWYQSFEELMKESTYWSWVAELWNWTSMDQYRSRFLKVIVWLASGKIKEGKLMEKLDWKRLEHRFRSCRNLSYGTSLAWWFWLSKLKKMNEGWHSIYRESNGMSKRVKWWSFEGNRVNLRTRKVWLLIWSKLNQNACFAMIITSVSSLNMFRSQNAQKKWV